MKYVNDYGEFETKEDCIDCIYENISDSEIVKVLLRKYTDETIAKILYDGNEDIYYEIFDELVDEEIKMIAEFEDDED